MVLAYDLGRMDYREAVEFQRARHAEVVAGTRESTLFFVEHPPVLTLGANFHEENLLLTPEEYAKRGIQVERTDRGGDVTYHGPGQMVVYPIFDLNRFGKDLHKWLRDLEEVFIQALGSYSIGGRRFPPHTGVWVEGRKIAAIGIRVSRWVSMHGVALNCNNDLGAFETIVPCGIRDFGVTSLSEETGDDVSPKDALTAVIRAFESVFSISVEYRTWM